MVTPLDRLARCVSDARDVADELTAQGVVLRLGGSERDRTDPVGRLLSRVPSMIAGLESDPIHLREEGAVRWGTSAALSLARSGGVGRIGYPPDIGCRKKCIHDP